MVANKRTAALLVAVGVGLVALGGCTDNPPSPSGSQSTGARATHPSTLPPGGASATSVESTGASTPPPAPVVALGDADQGRTVTVAVGQPVTLTLTGTDWKFVDPKPATVLTPSSPPVVSQANGTVSISFRAAKPGTAVATASRGAETYQITVIVQ